VLAVPTERGAISIRPNAWRESTAEAEAFPLPIATWHPPRAAARRSIYATISALSDAVSNAE
jgi:hypothetical protein